MADALSQDRRNDAILLSENSNTVSPLIEIRSPVAGNSKPAASKTPVWVPAPKRTLSPGW
jgi:hypothetical protein